MNHGGIHLKSEVITKGMFQCVKDSWENLGKQRHVYFFSEYLPRALVLPSMGPRTLAKGSEVMKAGKTHRHTYNEAGVVSGSTTAFTVT